MLHFNGSNLPVGFTISPARHRGRFTILSFLPILFSDPFDPFLFTITLLTLLPQSYPPYTHVNLAEGTTSAVKMFSLPCLRCAWCRCLGSEHYFLDPQLDVLSFPLPRNVNITTLCLAMRRMVTERRPGALCTVRAFGAFSLFHFTQLLLLARRLAG